MKSINFLQKVFLKKQASLLLEIIVSIGVFILIATSVVVMSLGSHTGTLRSEGRLEATAIAQQGVEAVRSIRDFDWTNLTVGAHGLSRVNGYWEFIGTSDTIGAYTRSIIVTEISPDRKDVAVNVSWEVTTGVPNSLTMTSRFTDWQSSSWILSSVLDFTNGFLNSLVITNTLDGELEFDVISDWSTPSILTSFDFDGSSDVNDIFLVGNTLYMVTNQTSAGAEFIVLDVSDVGNGNITKLGSFELSVNGNQIFVDGNYAYLATNHVDEEVMVIRLSDYTKVDTIDLPGADDANAVFVKNNTLYIGSKRDGNGNELFAYDVSNPESISSTPIVELEINSDVNSIFVDGNYAYITTEANTAELMIIRLSDYANINSYDLPGSSSDTALHVVGTVAYIIRDGSGVNDEFFALDVSDPTGTITLLGSVDTGSADMRDLYTEGDRAYIATGAQGNEELTIIDLTTYTIEATIDLLGSYNTGAIWFQGAYIYVGSDDNTHTLQVVYAGGVPSGPGTQYAQWGTFISQAFDSGSDSTIYTDILWTQSGTGTIKFQLRSANSEESLSDADWIGPDGTTATYYTTSGTIINAASNKRWIQLQALFLGDGTTTPILENITIPYAK
ncbi:MAG: hypothetical protein Q8P68_05285 [Candidatus Peregrinibacteria bacterium]|nr:hypothetical protein [Candidatus Peregrinibacteria bacterium]MDZ4244394.1 hypothetical protein [Candidatus Gracilibacteria bacterium]